MICLSCPPALHDIFHTPTAQYSLFVLKVPLNTNQLTNSRNELERIILQSSNLIHKMSLKYPVLGLIFVAKLAWLESVLSAYLPTV